MTCENPKILEVLMEHIVLHWDDIVQLLLDELIREEAIELNRLEFKQHDEQRGKKGRVQLAPHLAERSTFGGSNSRIGDFKSVDLKDIMSVFEDYFAAESSAAARAKMMGP